MYGPLYLLFIQSSLLLEWEQSWLGFGGDPQYIAWETWSWLTAFLSLQGSNFVWRLAWPYSICPKLGSLLCKLIANYASPSVLALSTQNLMAIPSNYQNVGRKNLRKYGRVCSCFLLKNSSLHFWLEPLFADLPSEFEWKQWWAGEPMGPCLVSQPFWQEDWWDISHPMILDEVTDPLPFLRPCGISQLLVGDKQ